MTTKKEYKTALTTFIDHLDSALSQACKAEHSSFYKSHIEILNKQLLQGQKNVKIYLLNTL